MSVEDSAGLALFDLDNTLFDRDAYFAQWAGEFVGSHDLPPRALEEIIARDDHGLTRRPELFEWLVARFRLGEPPAELTEEYVTDHAHRYRLGDDERAALVGLREAGWRLGVVTNGPPSQLGKVEHSGLDQLVDAVVVSGIYGVAKPDPAIFLEAARRCRVEPVGWMVGDSAHADIVGGRAAGLRTIWFERGDPWPDLGFQPDVRVRTIAEAAEVILGG